MEIAHLKYFYEVARLKSFTEASKHLHVSQPAISKIIKQFEDVNDIKLFNRTKKGVTLTDIGLIFFEKCKKIFGEIENLKNTTAYHKDSCVGDLLIGASDNICNYILPDILQKFSEKYPQVKIKLFSGTSTDIQDEILKGSSELGLFYTTVKDMNVFESEVLTYISFIIVCSPKSNTFDLNKLKNITSRIQDYNKEYPALYMLKSIDITPNIIIETNNQEVQKQMAINNFGYTLIPKHMATQDIKRNLLKEIPTKKELGCNMYLVTKKNRLLSKPAFLFQELLKKELKHKMESL